MPSISLRPTPAPLVKYLSVWHESDVGEDLLQPINHALSGLAPIQLGVPSVGVG